MIAQHWRFAALALAAVPLGACNSLFGIHSAKKSTPDYTRLVRIDGPSAVPSKGTATAEGRAHLSAGEPGAAAEAFQRALAWGEPVGPAANGLGVAYAQLGRNDLSQRFFEQALSADPHSERYAANLARLAQTEQLAAATAAAAMATEPLPQPVALAPSASQERRVDVAPPPAPLRRVSPREVRVVVAKAPDTLIVSPHRRQAVIALNARRTGTISTADLQRFRPVIRIVFATPSEKAAAAQPEPRWRLSQLARTANERAKAIGSSLLAKLDR